MSSRKLHLVLTRLARQDLYDLLQYSLLEWGPEQRDRYADALAQGFDRLRDFPAIGKTYAELPTAIRTHLVEHHNVVYTVRGGTVRVLRIVHRRMDLLRALQDI